MHEGAKLDEFFVAQKSQKKITNENLCSPAQNTGNPCSISSKPPSFVFFWAHLMVSMTCNNNGDPHRRLAALKLGLNKTQTPLKGLNGTPRMACGGAHPLPFDRCLRWGDFLKCLPLDGQTDSKGRGLSVPGPEAPFAVSRRRRWVGILPLQPRPILAEMDRP